MSDDLVKRLRDWENVYAVDDDKPEGSLYIEAADRIEELEAKLAKAAQLVERSFNEGFGEGMSRVLRQRGGKTWYDSCARKCLAELKGEK